MEINFILYLKYMHDNRLGRGFSNGRVAVASVVSVLDFRLVDFGDSFGVSVVFLVEVLYGSGGCAGC